MESINTYEKYEQSLTHPYTMIKATASWCSPCQKIHPQIVQLAENQKYNNINFYEYDIDNVDDCPLQEYIKVVPTFLFLEESNVVKIIKGSDVRGVEGYLNEIVDKIESDRSDETITQEEVVEGGEGDEGDEVTITQEEVEGEVSEMGQYK